jgi:hypothetical protein
MHVVNFALSGGDLGNEGRRAPLAPISNGVANPNAEARRRESELHYCLAELGTQIVSSQLGSTNNNRELDPRQEEVLTIMAKR